MDDLSFAADFPQATREQWLKLVEGVLKGADFQKKLVARTHDGIEIQPLYPKAEGSAPVAREQAGRWRVSQRVDHPDPAKANELALPDLEGGADALTLVTRKAPAARGFGVRIDRIEDLDRALRGVMLDLIHLRLDAGGHGRADGGAAAGSRRAARPPAVRPLPRSRPRPDRRHGGSGQHVRPLGRGGAAHGRYARPPAQRRASPAAPSWPTGAPITRPAPARRRSWRPCWRRASRYLRALEAQGHSLDAARGRSPFLLVADADEFLTVAKLRALRRLWARVEQACGLEPEPIRLHAETAWRMTTRRDPWVNMLRTTVAAFSAGIGGADAITVLPFTAALGLPDAFARRVARNTQLILLDESNLSRVADPAAGAGGFEALTDALCEKAWGLFQEIEREGGIWKA